LKTGTAIALAGAAFLLFFIAPTALAAGTLVFYPGAVTGISLVGSAPILQFTLQVQNTSGTSVTINAFAGNISCNNQLIGNVYNFSPVTIPARSSVALPVTAQLAATSIVNNIIAAFQASNTSETISLQGTVNAEGLNIPVSLTFNIGALI
jgi:LEA14-like dessication related protein